MSEEITQIEVPNIEAAKPEEKPTFAELETSGLMPQEIAAAKKHGLAVEKAPEKKAEGEEKPPIEGEKKANPPAEKKEELPKEFTEAFENPEKEKEMLSTFTEAQQGIYWRMRKEHFKRRTAEAQSDQLLVKLNLAEAENKRLKEELKKPKPAPKLDEFGEPIIEEDKPKEEVIEDDIPTEETAEEKTQKARVLRAKLNEFEIEGKTKYKDFDEVMDFTKEIIAEINAIERKQPTKGLFKDDPKTISKVRNKVFQLLHAMHNAEQFNEGEWNPSDMGYEIGLLHPNYGKKKDAPAANKEKEVPTPEQIAKMEKNAGRTSSAQFSGGGKKIVSVEDMTVEQFAALPASEVRKVPKHIRERLKKGF